MDATLAITRDELLVVDNMLLKNLDALRELGAVDMIKPRQEMRMRILAILDAAVTPS